jgi:hypothetical protein
MLQPKDIPNMEASLADKGFSVADLCRRAKIAETTWWRWKQGNFNPSWRAWFDVQTAFLEMTAPQEAAE